MHLIALNLDRLVHLLKAPNLNLKLLNTVQLLKVQQHNKQAIDVGAEEDDHVRRSFFVGGGQDIEKDEKQIRWKK